MQVADTLGSVALKPEPARLRADLDGEIGSARRGAEIGVRGGGAHAVIDVGLERAEPFGYGAVQILGEDMPGRTASLEEDRVERFLAVGSHHPDRPVTAAIGVGAPVPALRAAEVGKHLAIGPARCPLGRPALEVEGVAADEAEPIDARRSAEHLAARLIELATAQGRLGLARVAPVELLVLEQIVVGGRHADLPASVAASRLEQQDGDRRVFRQAGGQDAPGGPAADDDVVVFPAIRHHPCMRQALPVMRRARPCRIAIEPLARSGV